LFVRKKTKGYVILYLPDIYYSYQEKSDRVGFTQGARMRDETSRVPSILFPVFVPETVLLSDQAMLVFMGAMKPPMRIAKLCHWEAIAMKHLKKYYSEYLE
jgi:hypothetical protein